MASVPSFRTWVTGEIATATYFNANVRDAGNFFLSLPVCECRQTVAQSIPNVSGTALSFNTNDVDTDSGHSTVTNNSRYTAKTRGRFQVSGGISYAAHADSNAREVEIQVNGASIGGTDICVIGFSADNTRIGTRVKSIFLNGSTDFVQIVGFQASGGALNTVISSAQQPHMNVRWIGTT